jgi:NAD(P)-dependent dehydrogenase (short-subunit alcohol dehydrogenase family)
MIQTKPPQHQDQQPGHEHKMTPWPKYDGSRYKAAGKLEGRTALITGGDSGIGRAVAVLFAREGADIAFSYLNEHKDAELTKSEVETLGRRCLAIAGDLREEAFCIDLVRQSSEEFQKVDILVNNAAEQHVKNSLQEITSEQLESTFKTNIFSFFHVTKAALSRMTRGSAIINTTSVTAYRGSEHLLDYSATKGAIVTFTRSLSQMLVKDGIRVNAVSPGPIWTPLIPTSFSEEKVKEFGNKVPMGRPGQPEEVAPAYVFLASDDSSYMTGQVLHLNGGEIING